MNWKVYKILINNHNGSFFFSVSLSSHPQDPNCPFISNTKTCTHFKKWDKLFCFTGLLHNNELCRTEPKTHLWIQTSTYRACGHRYKLCEWSMVLFYGIPRQDISLPMGWKGSVLDWGPDFNVSGFAWYYALLRVKAELILYLCYLLSWEIYAGKGWLLSPLEFASHWFCYFWTAELHTGSGSLWKWLHAHSETGCISATLRMIFQEVSSFLEAYWLRYFHLRETSRDNFVQNSRRKKKVIRVFWKKVLHPAKALLHARQFMSMISDHSYQRMHLRQQLEPLFS